MLKSLSIVLILAPFLLGQAAPPPPDFGGTCSGSECNQSRRLKFTPGQRITIQIVNQTSSLVEIQKVYGTDPVPLRPGQEVQFGLGGGTEPNISVLFWDATALPLQSRLSRPNASTLRIELRPGGRPPGDRAVYVRDDGRVIVM